MLKRIFCLLLSFVLLFGMGGSLSVMSIEEVQPEENPQPSPGEIEQVYVPSPSIPPIEEVQPKATLPELGQKELEWIYNPKNYEQDFMPGEVLIGLKEPYKGESPESLFPELEIAAMEDLYLPVIDALYTDRSKAKTASRIGTAFIIKLPGEARESVLNAIEVLKRNPRVKYAQPNYIDEPCAIPNDPYYTNGNLWGLSKIDAPQAWDFTKGSASVKVGVLDSGIDNNHPDLSANIDMSLARNAAVTASPRPPENTMDYLGHGTHVAGIIGAVGNNGQGVTGVNWNVKMVPIRIALSDTDASSTPAIRTRAVQYANEKELPISNLSYSLSAYSYDFNVAVTQYSGLLVVAAGNNAANNDNNFAYSSLATYPNVLFVAATKSNDALPTVADWGYDESGNPRGSNYGANTVHLAAPGDEIRSTYPTSQCNNGTCGGASYGHVTNGYHNTGGTSQAAPHVSGVAALIKAKYPDLTTAQIKTAILESVDYVPALSGLVSTGGRLNAQRAVAHAEKIIVPDGEYFIRALHSGKYMDIPYGSTTSGTFLEQCAFNGQTNQRFLFTKMGNGYYKITPVCAPNMILEVRGGITNSDTNIQTYSYNANPWQHWAIVKNGTGFYISPRSAPGKGADVEGVSQNSGARILNCGLNNQNNQRWALEPVGGGGINNGAVYQIRAKHSGKFLDVHGGGGSGANVEQYSFNGAANQRWKFTNPSNGYYKISPMHDTGLSLNATGSSSGANNVNVLTSAPTSAQRWQPERTGDGTWRIKPENNTSNCLDIYNAGLNDGDRVISYSWGGGNNQRWYIEVVGT